MDVCEERALKLREYQEKAVDFLYENDRAMILAPVGAGKTAAALTAMQAMLDDGHIQRWLVVAPKRVCTHVWKQERDLWAPDLTISIAVGTPKMREAAFNANTQIVVTNYDNLQSLPSPLPFDGIVFDELTKLKNPSGKRYKALLEQIGNVNTRWGLTGSFTSNGLEDVFGQCKIVDASLLGKSKNRFLQQYFICVNREFGQWEPVYWALEQVMERIKPATFVLDNAEYRDKLPPLHTVKLYCELSDPVPYKEMKKNFSVDFTEATITALNAGVVVGKLQQMASGFVYDTIKHPNPDKPGDFLITQNPIWFSPHRFDLLEELLSENQRANTILVYNYKEELAELLRRYPHAQTLDSPNAIERWNGGHIELLLLHPKSAAHGLNLQYGGNKIVFVSLPWSLELYEQCIGRLHRSGQTQNVWCYLLLTENTVDEQILESLTNKRSISTLALEALK